MACRTEYWTLSIRSFWAKPSTTGNYFEYEQLDNWILRLLITFNLTWFGVWSRIALSGKFLITIPCFLNISFKPEWKRFQMQYFVLWSQYDCFILLNTYLLFTICYIWKMNGTSRWCVNCLGQYRCDSICHDTWPVISLINYSYSYSYSN